MSDVMEKTFSSVSGFIMNSIGSRNMDVSPGFHNLIRSIRKARSKTEEEKAIQRELELLKLKLQQPDTSVIKVKEFLVRIIYCEVLGYSASFSYIHAIKLAQQGSLATKRVGYLAISLFLHEDHELILLLVNTIQRDLSSTNMLHNCMALSAVCKLIGSEMVPAVLPLVEEKLKHPKALVRKKAVLALRSLYLKAPHMVTNPEDLFKQAVCDRDVAVMSAALHIHNDLIKEEPAANKQLVRPLVTILRQVFQRKLSSEYEYHGVSAPWMQIKLLRMLARLGAEDIHYSSLMYDILEDILQQSSALSHNIAFAVQYECLITVATIHPNEPLLIKAAQCIGKFLKSFNYNLKYMGICALSAILKVLPSCAEEHQLTVIDCLEDADDTIRLKTLDLLFQMTTMSNVEVICEKLLTVLMDTREMFTRQDLLSKIIQLTERFQPSVMWYLNTLTRLLTITDEVPDNVINHIISAISKESRRSSDIGSHALQLYLPLLTKNNTSHKLLKIGCWILGEFSDLDTAPPASEILATLCSHLERRLDEDLEVWVMGTLTKVVGRGGGVTADVRRVIEKCLVGPSMELRQRAFELQKLCNSVDLMTEAHPWTSSDELQFDWSLSFLDQYVSDALSQGVAPYKPKQQRHAERQDTTQVLQPQFAGLNFVPYRSPTSSMVSGHTVSTSTPEGRTTIKSTSSPEPSLSSGASGNSAEPRSSESLSGLKLQGVKRVWGQKGYTKTTSDAKTQSHPQGGHRPLPSSSQATPSSPSRGIAPTVQLSLATAVGVTTSSAADIGSPEENRKKELAKALFGGLQKTMTTSSSKQPLDRKPQLSVATHQASASHSSKADQLHMDKSLPDLLTLSEQDSTFPHPDPLNVQFASHGVQNMEINNINPSHGETNKLIEGFSDQQENVFVNRTELNQPTKKQTALKQNQLIKDNVIHHDINNENISVNGTEDLEQRKTDNVQGLTQGLGAKQQSMYEEFKDFNLSDGDSANSLTRNNDNISVTETKEGHGERMNQSSEISEEECLASNANPNLTTLGDLSSISNNKSGLNPMESKDQLNPGDNPTSKMATATEISILDFSVGDSPFTRLTDDLPINIPADWSDYPRACERIHLCQDTSLGVTLLKVWKPDALGLVFNVTNPNPKETVTGVKIKLDISSNLKLCTNPTANSLSKETIEPNTTGILTAELNCVSSAQTMRLGGEISYKDYTKTNRRLFFSSPILVSDLLRPLKLQTSDFGEQWQRQTHDCKLDADVSPAVTMSKVMTLMTHELNLHLVEIIGNEGITCGSLVNGSISLLHLKLPSSTSLHVWIRSSSQLLSDSIAKQFKDNILKMLESNADV
ncbi:AP-4 complex subunit epsilon-1-like isoform X2 [Asterias amurensis]|uniref:AP-4 complex subunit epsilon-1-like isoform X2 n=1 Tax=Asterias amurensis TaxID=7602 RepID=UPI003AB8614C